MKKSKVVLALMLCSALFLQLGACNQKEVTAPIDLNGETKNNSDEKITIRVMDWSDSTKTVRQEFNEQYMAEHTNINIEYTMLTEDQFKTTVMTAVKSGDAPDLFPVPNNISLATAVSQQWYQPLDQFLTDEFKNSLQEGSFVEGLTQMDGKIYTIPEAFDIPNTLVFYNKNILKESGIDTLPETWSEFREANKKITEKGNGKYYGMLDGGAQTPRLDVVARSWSLTAGSKALPGIIMVNDKSTVDSKGLLEYVALYKGLKDDGSIHPNSVSIKAPEARALFAQGQAGFIVQGCWAIPIWRADNPDFEFGVMNIPVPDEGRKGYIAAGAPKAWMGISKNTKYPKETAEYLKALYSKDYQSKCVGAGGYVSLVKGINEEFMKDPEMLDYYTLSTTSAVIVPNPITESPDNAKVVVEVKDIQPNLGQIMQGVLSGAITDYEKEIKTFSENSTKEWKRAAETSKVDIKNFDISAWDPMENYKQ